MNLFVDANIFLDFYHFSDDDLEELKKLVDVINKGEISLIVTTQVIDEVRRNRDNKVSDAYIKFRDSKAELNLPQICKSYGEYTKIKKALRDLKKLKSDLDTKLVKDITGRSLKADEIINRLFEIAETIDTRKYLDEARVRYQLGNPPGKDESYGDSVNWVALIGELEDKKDLFFVSDDKDYKSPISEYALNSFLLDEWKAKKNSDIFFYTKLSDFFNDHHKDIQLKVEEEKNELINDLRNSPNFENTHHIISRLSKYVSFTDGQIRELVNVASENSQVNWILGDPDVKGFYEKLIEGKEHLIESSILDSLTKKMRNEEDSAEDIDIPF